jgi:acyl phosphate:glycerol-3-phosphate acyltransferase
MGIGPLDQPWVAAAVALLGGYLLGSIPFGVIVSRLGGAADPRGIGSGNIGATNVLRSGRKGLAVATLILDAAKGAAAVMLARAADPALAPLAAAAAFFGHLYPLWLGFRGGKGVATLLGLALALYWPIGLICAAVWIAALALTRISSAGGMSAAMAAPIAAAVLGRFDLTLLFLALALMILWTHRANIARLLDGTEPRIGERAPS